MTALKNVTGRCLRCGHVGEIHVDEYDTAWSTVGFRPLIDSFIICSSCGSRDVEGVEPGSAAVVNAAQLQLNASLDRLARHRLSRVPR